MASGGIGLQRFFHKPGILEEIEENVPSNIERPKFQIGGDSPLLTRTPSQFSSNRISSLARISTCNSSFTRVPSAARLDNSR